MKIKEVERHDMLWTAGLLSLTIGGMLVSVQCGFLLLGAGLMIPVLIDVIRG